MKIEEVSLGDIDQIIALEKRAFQKDAFTSELIRKLMRRNLFFLKIQDPASSELIGFIIVVKDREDRANIINFLINPTYHRKGYGSLLLRTTLQKIRNFREITRVVLNVKTDNLAAIKLYESHQFQIKKKIDNYYKSGDSSFLMRRDFQKQKIK